MRSSTRAAARSAIPCAASIPGVDAREVPITEAVRFGSVAGHQIAWRTPVRF